MMQKIEHVDRVELPIGGPRRDVARLIRHVGQLEVLRACRGGSDASWIEVDSNDLQPGLRHRVEQREKTEAAAQIQNVAGIRKILADFLEKRLPDDREAHARIRTRDRTPEAVYYIPDRARTRCSAVQRARRRLHTHTRGH